jgi:P-type Mg2+ transporter
MSSQPTNVSSHSRFMPYGRGEYVDGRQPWWRYPLSDNLTATDANKNGLSTEQARARLVQFGKNSFRDAPPQHVLLQFIQRFRNPLVLLLLFAGTISAATGDVTSAIIIAAMVILSVLLDFIQAHRAEAAAERLKQSVALRAVVLRDGRQQEIDAHDIVPGDIVMLRAGQLVPADGRVLSAQDLFVQQSSLTGESYPVEKRAEGLPASDELHLAANALFMGSSLVSGQATMLVCATGTRTQIGHVAQAVIAKRSKTAFEQGIQQFGNLILMVTSALVVFVMLVNLLAHKPLLESFMFALALAVGLTPELLPMVVTVTLTRGALRLSRRHVVVKRLSAIQDLGAIDVLCTDKTGTLTEGNIRLERHLDIHGNSSETVLRHAWLNCAFETGVRTPMEDAVLAHETIDASGWSKIDEVPFDFERRRLSVLLEQQQEDKPKRRWLILKGAPSDVLAHCTTVCEAPETTAAAVPFDAPRQAIAQAQLRVLEQAGFRTLTVAVKEMPLDRDHARLADEDELTLMGILAFLDPPKHSAADAMRTLARYAVKVKIVSGDSELVTQYICDALKMPVNGILMGHEIARMDDATLRTRVESADLFCRVNPMQKNRVILALKANGHVVGYLGDGINDAPALHNADVGISVDTAVDVAKAAADLILLRQDLDILAHGVREGRRTFGNVRKYIMMGTSSNFGNMFSMAGAALFLPFLPMQPVQILLNNILYDLSESVIPLDAVDEREIMTPQKWDMRFLRNFMLALGPVSSLFDFLTFYLLLQVLHAGERAFQTGWFVESLATQVLVIFVIRTSLNPFRSRPHWSLVVTAIVVLCVAVALPFSGWGAYVGFVALPLWFYGTLALLVVAYLLIAQIVKMVFYRMIKTGMPAA